MAKKRARQTFEKLKREQTVRERRVRKRERKEAARLARTSDVVAAEAVDGDDAVNHDETA